MYLVAVILYIVRNAFSDYSEQHDNDKTTESQALPTSVLTSKLGPVYERS